MEAEKNTEYEDNSGYLEIIGYEKANEIEFENRYRILNRDILGNKTMIPWFSDEAKQEIEDYAETVKGDLIEVWEEDSIFPQGLVIELENMIYQSLNRSMKKTDWEEKQQSIYFESMQKLGEKKWHPDFSIVTLQNMKINNANSSKPTFVFAATLTRKCLTKSNRKCESTCFRV